MLVTVAALAMCGCTDDDAGNETTSPELSSTNAATPITPVPSPTVGVSAPVPAGFCELAAHAADGNIAFSDPAATDALTEFDGLTEEQRQVITAAVETTRDEIERAGPDGSWSNNEMIAAVNQLCGTDVTSVTLTP